MGKMVLGNLRSMLQIHRTIAYLVSILDKSFGMVQHMDELDPLSKTFIKVYKSGSIGRSLDITRFSNYTELHKALGQMFSIEGQLEDPLRSGRQLVFVDRENDVLLLGDDPWELYEVANFRGQKSERRELSDALSQEIARENFKRDSGKVEDQKEVKSEYIFYMKKKLSEGISFPVMLNIDLPLEHRCSLCNTIFEEAVMIPSGIIDVAGEAKCDKYSRRRPLEGWSFTIEKLGSKGKRGAGGGWKFVGLPDGSSHALNEMEKMYVKRETPKHRRRILPTYK